MRKYVIIMCAIGCLLAHTRYPNSNLREFQHARHDTNNIKMVIGNFGTFGQGESGNWGGCWWLPTGWDSLNYYIYGAGVWFGTLDSLTGDTLVTIGYGPSGGQFEFAPGLSGWPVDHPAAVIYMYPDNWPPPADTFPMAPQDTVSYQDSWCCYNDSDIQYHIIGDTRPIDIEVYQTVYAWSYPFADDIIYLTCDVKNVSGHNLTDCYFGVCTDCDVGNEAGTNANDICTGIVERTYLINNDTITVDDVGYQWQEEPEYGWPDFPGVIAFDLLQTPFDLVSGQDKDGDGILDQYERDSAYYVNYFPPSMWDVDLDGVPDWRDPSQWPQYGMSALKRFTLDLEPSVDAERYATLAGYDFVTGLYEPYDTIIPDPNDQRFLMSSGPFDLAPDSVATLVFAIMIAAWHDIYVTPDTAVVLVDQRAQLHYDLYWFTYTGIEKNYELRITNCKMKITPNPVTYNGNVRFSLNQPGYATLKLYNTLGQLVTTFFEGPISTGEHELRLDVSELPHGTYFLVLETPEVSKSQTFVVVR